MGPFDVQGDLQRPATVGPRRSLRHGFGEASVGGCAGWKPELSGEYSQVAFNIGVVECVDYGDGLAGPARVGGRAG